MRYLTKPLYRIDQALHWLHIDWDWLCDKVDNLIVYGTWRPS